MITSSPIEADLVRDEGIRDRPYVDTTGHSTIGVGHNLSASGLCDEAIFAQLRFDIAKVEHTLDSALPWWIERPEEVQRVLLNLGFNLGVAGLLGFRTFVALVESEDYAGAAEDLLKTRYAKQVGSRAIRLAKLLRSVVD